MPMVDLVVLQIDLHGELKNKSNQSLHKSWNFDSILLQPYSRKMEH